MTKRLSGADAQFLLQETRAQHLHTIKMGIFDVSATDHGTSVAYLREHLSRVVAQNPVYRWRLVKVPLSLGLPLWVEEPTLDYDYHIRRAALPSPGGMRELCEVVSMIASTPLERDRPLWQLWVVEGLEQGHVACVLKLHHAVADGAASAQLLLDSVGVSNVTEVQATIESLRGEPIPSGLRLTVDAMRQGRRLLARLPSLCRRTVAGVRIHADQRKGNLPLEAIPYTGPVTRFNRRLTPHRWYANVTVPLADMRLVKDAFGVTINDVLLAMASTAVRGYLEAHRELPREPLMANVPVSIRRPEEQHDYGNRLTAWCVSLATHVADPVERLRAVSLSARVAREVMEKADNELLYDWQEYWFFWNVWMKHLSKVARGFFRRPVSNAIVSNVRGPGAPLVYQGARLVALQSMGPLIGDIGLNITAWSYVGDLSIGLVSCREHVPDIWNLAERFPVALNELKALAETRSAQLAPPATRPASGRGTQLVEGEGNSVDNPPRILH